MGNKIKRYIDLHNDKAAENFIPVIFGALIVLSIVIRFSLVNFQSGDYVTIASWYNFLKVHGLHGFKYSFYTYNSPFLYFLYIATKLPVSEIVAIKSMLILFDGVLAASVYLVVKVFKPKHHIPLMAALVTMFLPTVLLTGVFGSQFDQLYTALVFFSLYFGIKDNSKLSWIAFGLAISVKLQAIFFTPILIIMCFKRIKWYDIFWGALAYFIVSFPPVIVGRPFSSILTLYSNQTGKFNHYLTANAPNIWQWVPVRDFAYFDHVALILALVFSLFLLLISLYQKRFSNRDLLMLTTISLYALPFLLPAMHERYFFPASIASLLMLFVYPSMVNAVTAVLSQVIIIFSYCPFLFQTMPVPFTYLSFGMLIIIMLYLFQFIKGPLSTERLKTATRKAIT